MYSRIIAALIISFVTIVEAAAGSAPVTLLYTANTLGKYQACPTCGNYAIGGLDRRSTVFTKRRDQSGATFTLAGGFEFASYLSGWVPKDGQMQALAQAYDALGYDLGVLSAKDREFLVSHEATLPEHFVAASAIVGTRILSKAGVRLGVVILPALDAGTRPGQQQMARVAAAADELRGRCDIVVGLSIWGGPAEKALLQAFPGRLDLLLGSGPGTGSGSRVLADGKTLWLRPEYDGRSVMALDLSSFMTDKIWKQHRGAELVPLDYHVRGDGRISSLFAWI